MQLGFVVQFTTSISERDFQEVQLQMLLGGIWTAQIGQMDAGPPLQMVKYSVFTVL